MSSLTRSGRRTPYGPSLLRIGGKWIRDPFALAEVRVTR